MPIKSSCRFCRGTVLHVNVASYVLIVHVKLLNSGEEGSLACMQNKRIDVWFAILEDKVDVQIYKFYIHIK